jgi:hypothetical protein
VYGNTYYWKRANGSHHTWEVCRATSAGNDRFNASFVRILTVIHKLLWRAVGTDDINFIGEA